MRGALCGVIGWLVLTAAVAQVQAIAYSDHEVAEGVYVFTSSELGMGNVAAIVNGDAALIVDTAGTPKTAQAVVSRLGSLGVVRLVAVVNTHWHDDHIWGNQTFATAYPKVPIVAHPATIRDIRERAVPELTRQIERLRQRIAERERQIEAAVFPDGRAMAASDIQRLRSRQAVFREAAGALESVVPTLPTVVAESAHRFDVGGLEVVVEHVGRAHTEGDLLVSVPQRGILIAGDLVTLPVPAAADASVSEWIDVLEQILRRPWRILVPGHGGTEASRDYVRDVVRLMRETRDFVRRGLRQGLAVDDLVEGAAFPEFADRWVGDKPRGAAMFQAFYVEPAVRSLYAELTGE